MMDFEYGIHRKFVALLFFLDTLDIRGKGTETTRKQQDMRELYKEMVPSVDPTEITY